MANVKISALANATTLDGTETPPLVQGGTTKKTTALNIAKTLLLNAVNAPSSISVTASPFTYQNASAQNAGVIVSGGTVSAIAFSRDNLTFFTTGQTAGMFTLSPNDYLKVTYSGLPTMTLVPQ